MEKRPGLVHFKKYGSTFVFKGIQGKNNGHWLVISATPISFFYCSATRVMSQLLQPTSVNKWYRGHHTFSSVHFHFKSNYIHISSNGWRLSLVGQSQKNCGYKVFAKNWNNLVINVDFFWEGNNAKLDSTTSAYLQFKTILSLIFCLLFVELFCSSGYSLLIALQFLR